MLRADVIGGPEWGPWIALREKADPARPHEQARDDQHGAPQDLPAKQRDHAADDQQYGQEPQQNVHAATYPPPGLPYVRLPMGAVRREDRWLDVGMAGDLIALRRDLESSRGAGHRRRRRLASSWLPAVCGVTQGMGAAAAGTTCPMPLTTTSQLPRTVARSSKAHTYELAQQRGIDGRSTMSEKQPI